MNNLEEMKIIAHIHTDFGGKFGVPRQSGLVPELRVRLSLNPIIGHRTPSADSTVTPISGSFGNFLKIFGRAGRPPYARQDWVETPEWGFCHPLTLPPEPHRTELCGA